MRNRSVIYAILFAFFSFAALSIVSKLGPGFGLFTDLYLDIPVRIWFGDKELLSRGVSVLLEVLALSSVAVSSLVLLARDEKPAVVSAVAGSFSLLFSIFFFGFDTTTLLFAVGVFLGVFFFAGGSGKALRDGERLSAGGKLVSAFFFINLFIGVGTYLAFSQNSASYGGVIFEKVVDNALVMAGKMSGGLEKGVQSQMESNVQMLLEAQRATVDATAYGMNQYLIAQGQQPVPAQVVGTLKAQIADEARLRSELGKVNLQQGIGINRDLVKNILDPLLSSQIISILPLVSASLIFFLLEFLSNGFKLVVPLFVVLIVEAEKLAEKAGKKN